MTIALVSRRYVVLGPCPIEVFQASFQLCKIITMHLIEYENIITARAIRP